MNIIGIASLISALLVIDHFVKYPINVEAVKAHLGALKQWLRTGDKEVVYPVALLVGFSVAVIASWLRWVLV